MADRDQVHRRGGGLREAGLRRRERRARARLTPRAAQLAVVAAVSAALVACGAGDGGGDETAPPAAPAGAEVPWQRAEPVDGGRTLRVHVQTDPCHLPIRAARVAERDDEVELTLIGPVIEPDAVCIQIAVTRCVTVRLPSPLRGRDLVDGARRGREPPRGGGEPPTADACPRVPVFER